MNKSCKKFILYITAAASLFISSCGGPSGNIKGVQNLPDGIYQYARPSIYKNGMCILFAATKNGKTKLCSMDINGKNAKPLFAYRYNTVSPAINRNGDKIAFVIDKSKSGRGIIATCGIDGRNFKQITKDQSSKNIYDRLPSFTPDGKYIIFQRSQKHAFIQEFWKIRLSDLKEEKLMKELSWHPTAPVISPDNRYFLYGQMVKMTFKDNKKIFPFRIFKFDLVSKNLSTLGILGKNSPCLSPDGRNIIYTGTDDAALFISNSKGENPQRIFYSEYKCKSPAYSNDGRNVIFLHFKEKWAARAALTVVNIATKTTKEITPEWIK